MSLAILASQALYGLDGSAVRVEVHVGPGLPAFNVVGLPDAGIRESRERVRSAIVSSGFEFPAARITANLAPADLPKESGRFDLPIAFGVLLASGQVASTQADQPSRSVAPKLEGYVFAGELSLTGALVPIGAPVALALAVARHHPGCQLILPASIAGVAAQVRGLQVLSAKSLTEVVDHFCGIRPLSQAVPQELKSQMAQVACLSDVRGQTQARRALEVAAAGGHSLLMSGPPGVGKSMLAQRFPGILPLLTDEQALEVAAVRSIVGEQPSITSTPPFRAPHHSASRPALIGGGSTPVPGEISLAHNGVLFLDEFPEFERRALEALREPLETGSVTIARASRTATFPARFQLIAAMNPCPCGWLGHARRNCTCSAERIANYRAKLSGPLLDRIDLHIILAANESDWLTGPPGTPSGKIRPRVQVCRARQLKRQATVNAKLDVHGISAHCVFDAPARQLMQKAVLRWSWSTRVIHRVLRVARTLADMDESDLIGQTHIAEATQYRQS